MHKYQWADSYIRRWKVALGAILTSSLLLASNVSAALTTSVHSHPTTVHLASLQMDGGLGDGSSLSESHGDLRRPNTAYG